MNKIVHLGLFLAIVSAVAGGALAFANQMTRTTTSCCHVQ